MHFSHLVESPCAHSSVVGHRWGPAAAASAPRAGSSRGSSGFKYSLRNSCGNTEGYLSLNIHILSLQTLQQQLKNGSAASASQFSTTVSCARTLCPEIQVFILGLSVSLPALYSPGGCRCQVVPVPWAVPMPWAVPCHQAAVLPGWELPQTFLRARTGRWEWSPSLCTAPLSFTTWAKNAESCRDMTELP